MLMLLVCIDNEVRENQYKTAMYQGVIERNRGRGTAEQRSREERARGR
jgi:hypothetical protein